MWGKIGIDLGTMILGTAATKVAALGLDYLLNTKQSNSKLSSNGDSQNGLNSMHNATSNSTGVKGTSQPTITDPYYKSSWADTLKTVGYTAAIAIPAYNIATNLLGNKGSSNKNSNTNKSSNSNTIKPNINTKVQPKIEPKINTTIDPSIENEIDVDVENEVDYTPSSFHNFVPTINIAPPEYNDQLRQLPPIEINPKSAVFVPYEPGYKSKPKIKNNVHPIYNLDWMYKTQHSPGFSNI